MRSCASCGGRAQYRDRTTGDYLCLEHARLAVVAAKRREPVQGGRGSAASGLPLEVRPAASTDYPQIEALSLYFWEETVVDCFDRQYDVMVCPAFLACDGDEVVGAAPFAVEEAWDAIVLVMLNVLPGYQGRGGGRSLLDALCEEARRRDLALILVATTNDDLPALALYQRFGFHITEIVTGRVMQDHGAELVGFAGITVRDEVRLEYHLSVRGE